MSTRNKEFKPLTSKKWLYGSLAVIALALGLILNNDAMATDSDSALNTVEQVDIDKEDGDISIEDEESDDDFDFDYEEEDSYPDDYLSDIEL